jgi:CheY-like chemotaxis protein
MERPAARARGRVERGAGPGVEPARARHRAAAPGDEAASTGDPGADLSGAVADDLKNVLTVILGHTEFALAGPGLSDGARSDIREAYRAGQRAALLATQLVNLGRVDASRRTLVDLRPIVEAMALMLGPLVGEGIVVRVLTGRRPVPAMADPVEIETVVLNLALNARDAMPAGGLLVLGLEEPHRSGGGGSPATVLSVTDTGIGMDEATRVRAFEPFFTTKAPGRGSGLGLASVASVIERNGWHLAVESAPGRGSRFRITIPLVDGGESRRRGVAPLKSLAGTERILVVEPDISVRAIACRALRLHGYAVSEIADLGSVPAPAGGATDLIVLSLEALGAGGRAVASELAAVRPGARLLLLTTAEDRHRRAGDPPTQFLAKPFTARELALAVRSVLDESDPRVQSASRSGGAPG